ncbi:uncharacterized protein LOC109837227 [Asparagus officinalis]|uniref:uncharacterized protein LOC109837227 n=1 Tax=Asparagus officinalis TaxID=4686 RepID=UPI00098E4AC0|nr:uncharacterized protein LOC109837227 [Asparagus officinalis]
MKITKGWKWISNVHEASKGRIWILLDSDIFIVQKIISSEQYITCSIESRDGRFSSMCTIVYALNQIVSRKILWHDLLAFKHNVNGPWIIGGDFNAITGCDEKIGGMPVSDADTEDFQSFITTSQLLHIRSIGCFFTWSNKQEAKDRIWSRLDRCLVNVDWIHLYTSRQVEFLMPSCSDHSPTLLTIEDDVIEGKRPFKFFNMWVKHPDFILTVKSIWKLNIEGYKLYRLHSKLKKLKYALKELNKKHFMNISEQVLRVKEELTDIQWLLSVDLFNLALIAREKECITKYDRLLDCESSFYKQKANINWSLEGDKGSKFFHSIMKKKTHLNRILTLYTKIDQE